MRTGSTAGEAATGDFGFTFGRALAVLEPAPVRVEPRLWTIRGRGVPGIDSGHSWATLVRLLSSRRWLHAMALVALLLVCTLPTAAADRVVLAEEFTNLG